MSERGLSHADIALLYRRFGPMCLRRASRFLPAHEAADVLQDVFAKLVAEPRRMRHDEAPGAWLYRVTTRACIDRLRATRRYLAAVDGSALVAETDDPGTVAEARVFLGALWARLDAELVHVGVMYYLDGMTTADIGAALGVSDRTIANRLKELARAAQRVTR